MEYGIPYLPHKEQVAQVSEAIQVITKIWTEDKASFSGEYYKVEDAECCPRSGSSGSVE